MLLVLFDLHSKSIYVEGLSVPRNCCTSKDSEEDKVTASELPCFMFWLCVFDLEPGLAVNTCESLHFKPLGVSAGLHPVDLTWVTFM